MLAFLHSFSQILTFVLKYYIITIVIQFHLLYVKKLLKYNHQQRMIILHYVVLFFAYLS